MPPIFRFIRVWIFFVFFERIIYLMASFIGRREVAMRDDKLTISQNNSEIFDDDKFDISGSTVSQLDQRRISHQCESEASGARKDDSSCLNILDSDLMEQISCSDLAFHQQDPTFLHHPTKPSNSSQQFSHHVAEINQTQKYLTIGESSKDQIREHKSCEKMDPSFMDEIQSNMSRTESHCDSTVSIETEPPSASFHIVPNPRNWFNVGYLDMPASSPRKVKPNARIHHEPTFSLGTALHWPWVDI